MKLTTVILLACGCTQTNAMAGGDMGAVGDGSAATDQASPIDAASPPDITAAPDLAELRDLAEPRPDLNGYCNRASDCPIGQACTTGHRCDVLCSATTVCNGGCCSGGTCQPGNQPEVCAIGSMCGSCLNNNNGTACLPEQTGERYDCGCTGPADCADSTLGHQCVMLGDPPFKCGCTGPADCIGIGAESCTGSAAIPGTCQ